MKDFLSYFVLPMIVALFTIWFSGFVLHDLYKSAVGYNISDLNEMKKQCEKDLPRSQSCVGEFKFVVKPLDNE